MARISATQKERWVKDIKLVMRVGDQFVAKDIARKLMDYDWSTHQKKLNRGARSRALQPSTMQVIGVLRPHPDFQQIDVDTRITLWRRIR
tara:strand:- start:1704 stop:1973 length:270 start_codon:yes stop_codon:yes gene_type:complete